MKFGPFSGLAGDTNRPAVAFDDALDHGQPQTGSQAFFFGCKIRIKYSINSGVVHSMTGITHGQLNIRPWEEIMEESCRLFIQVHRGQSHLQHTALFPHGMVSIGAKIHHYLVDLGGIGQDSVRLCYDILANLDGSRQRGS